MAIPCLDQIVTENYAIYNGDSFEIIKCLGDESIDFSLFSPPFVDLYCYSNSERDLGNCKGYKEFFQQFSYLIADLFRVTKPGRLVAVHCIDIPAMKERDGYIGLKDFPGDIIREFVSAGFIYHSRTVIWKDPLIEATRTKALGLMHKQLCKDSSKVRAGLPDYLIAFRKPGEAESMVTHPEGLTEYHGSDDPGGVGEKRSHHIWRAYASPVWMDIRQTETLNRTAAREEDDEKHICPLQLDIIHRACVLWSNPGEVVLTPFMGIGSEVYGALINGRKAIGIELKQAYFNQAVKNVAEAAIPTKEQPDLIPA
jgi:DNA modification methylase